jgi:hypothetical protein
MNTNRPITIVRNIVLWFGSVFLAISIFSLVYGWPYGPASVLFVFRVTLMFALPVACLCLPLVISLGESEKGRPWSLLGAGTLIGPACIILWGLIAALRGSPSVWHSDGLGLGLGVCLVVALLVGFLATAFYLIALKAIHRWIATPEHRI